MKYEFIFDDVGNLTSTIYYEWDDGLSRWKGYNKIEHSFDSNGNETLIVNSYWDKSKLEWVGSKKMKKLMTVMGININCFL